MPRAMLSCRAKLLPRHALRCLGGVQARFLQGTSVRLNHSGQTDIPTSPVEKREETEPKEKGIPPALSEGWKSFKQSRSLSKETAQEQLQLGQRVTLHGFLSKRKDLRSTLSFCTLKNGQRTIQLKSSWEAEGSPEQALHLKFKAIPAYSAVTVVGTVEPQLDIRRGKPSATEDAPQHELRLHDIKCLNSFPRDIIVSKDAVWPPKSRHLQIRFDPLLADRLHFRAGVNKYLRQALDNHGFEEVETPVLFKSTSEGAREFLVPTRRRDYAYALPQSPQQYKQILMSAGITKYFQFARCFRDEDHRVDRQPEFTQLDLEMAFADDHDVMKLVENLMSYLSRSLTDGPWGRRLVNGKWQPVHRLRESGPEEGGSQRWPAFADSFSFKQLSYDEAMTRYGSDKPDGRITASEVSDILRVDHLLPKSFVNMITSLEDPIVEACQFRLEGSPRENHAFMQKFFDELSRTPHKLDDESSPGILLIDEGRVLAGLSSLGDDAANKILDMDSDVWQRCATGSVIVFHARKNQPFQGAGSTELGKVRRMIWERAVADELLPRPDRPFSFLWINQFPMFTPNDDGAGAGGDNDPGQGGAAGFSATHHPFTAPLGAADLELLRTAPLAARAAHYDLVLNGVEVGGGSRRIHDAGVQEYVMRDVLRMTGAGVGQFAHLLAALRAGCPPHAGFAFGFDRFVAALCDEPSVRDVIAFPKTNRGEDPLVGSPAEITEEQRRTYHFDDRPAPHG
ncbi:tRNA synthetases class II-domain-containing protein [Xylariaceae sp. FL0804]|nr:tRNA synthetases class II-domain-containing protein [Xylariaceae sp. FL0804]